MVMGCLPEALMAGRRPRGRWVWRNLAAVAATGAAALLWLIFIQPLGRHRPREGPKLVLPEGAPPPSLRTLEFPLCNGYANQLLSLFYGSLVALESGRALAGLPMVITDGMQRSPANYLGTPASLMPPGALWDEEALRSSLESNGVRVLPRRAASNASRYEASGGDMQQMSLLRAVESHSKAEHIKIGCPLFKLPAAVATRRSSLFFSLLSTRPCKPIADAVVAELLRVSGRETGGGFNTLHLRVEDDWLRHCQSWKAGRCLGDYRHVGDYLRFRLGVSPSLPLLVITDAGNARKEVLGAALENLRSTGYNVTLTSREMMRQLPRESRAILYYFVALNSDFFVGNSISTLTAVLMMHRRALGRPAAHYNEGTVPLNQLITLLTLPWVFVHNEFSNQSDESAVRRAVLSANAARGHLQPFCIFRGGPKSLLRSWMESNGVQVLDHSPEWASGLAEAGVRAAEDLVTVLMALDMPVLEPLREHAYALVTEQDVFFRGPVILETLEREIGGLPSSIAVSVDEDRALFPGHGPVMLVNLPHLRATYNKLVEKTFAWKPGRQPPPAGLDFYAAYDTFYDHGTWLSLPSKYNSKPFKPQDDAVIVHLHGPRPFHYLEQLAGGRCSYPEPLVCQEGLAGFCRYVERDGLLADMPMYESEAKKGCKALAEGLHTPPTQ